MFDECVWMQISSVDIVAGCRLVTSCAIEEAYISDACSCMAPYSSGLFPRLVPGATVLAVFLEGLSSGECAE